MFNTNSGLKILFRNEVYSQKYYVIHS